MSRLGHSRCQAFLKSGAERAKHDVGRSSKPIGHDQRNASMVPAKDFDISKRFYIELGFQPPRPLTDRLVEMQLGALSFILQAYYVRE